MENDEVAKFYNRSLFKGMIINQDLVDMCKNFENEKDFDLFLGIITDLIVEEKEFFMLKDNFVFKIVTVLSEHFNSSSESNQELINDLYEYFRKVIELDEDDKNYLLSNYKAEYECARGCSLDDDEHLLCISNDALLLKMLFYDDVSEIDIDKSVLFSIDYILYSCPEIFKDKKIYTKVLLLIDKCIKEDDIGSEYEYNANEIKSDIQKIYKKKV